MPLRVPIVLLPMLVFALYGCSGSRPQITPIAQEEPLPETEYVIGPGDTLRIFVWRNDEFSQTVPVRPDGRISSPLVEDMVAEGKTPTQLSRDLERVLSHYVRNPEVTVIVTSFVGAPNQQIRVIGEAVESQAIPYRKGMTLLDVIIAVGGLTDSAAGNRATIVRERNGQRREIPVRLEDLLRDGDINANVRMAPGDILVIPQSWL